MIQALFKPGEKIGVRLADRCYNWIARGAAWYTGSPADYDASTTTLQLYDVGETDENQERTLGQLDAMFAIMPALFGVVIAEYAGTVGDLLPDEVGGFVELTGVLLLYLLAAGAMSRLDDLTVVTMDGETA